MIYLRQAIYDSKTYCQQLTKLYKYLHYNQLHFSFDRYLLTVPYHYLQALGMKLSVYDKSYKCLCDMGAKLGDQSPHIDLYIDTPPNDDDFEAIHYKDDLINYCEVRQPTYQADTQLHYRIWTQTPKVETNNPDIPDGRDIVLQTRKTDKFTNSEGDVRTREYLTDTSKGEMFNSTPYNLLIELENYIFLLKAGLRLKIPLYQHEEKKLNSESKDTEERRIGIHNGKYSWRNIFGDDDKVHHDQGKKNIDYF